MGSSLLPVGGTESQSKWGSKSLASNTMQKDTKPKLERSPLQFVLVQFRFSPITAMSEYVPRLQEILRKSGFPGFSREQIQQVIFGPTPKAETTSRWCFVSRDKREGVVLTEDYVVYETTRYDVFETFTDRVKRILEKLNNIAEIGFATQIGLRYVDVIRSLDGHPPNWFIREEVQGLNAQGLSEKAVVNQFLSMITTNEGILKIKSLEGVGPGFMPPDLEATRLDFDLSMPEGEAFRVLDFDHIWKGEVDFVPDRLIQTMELLHNSIGKAFMATVKPEAIEVWKSKGNES
jgi:uncharacterized protein (TIGR04255 family)